MELIHLNKKVEEIKSMGQKELSLLVGTQGILVQEFQRTGVHFDSGHFEETGSLKSVRKSKFFLKKIVENTHLAYNQGQRLYKMQSGEKVHDLITFLKNHKDFTVPLYHLPFNEVKQMVEEDYVCLSSVIKERGQRQVVAASIPTRKISCYFYAKKPVLEKYLKRKERIKKV